jgi:hypothetical protein
MQESDKNAKNKEINAIINKNSVKIYKNLQCPMTHLILKNYIKLVRVLINVHITIRKCIIKTQILFLYLTTICFLKISENKWVFN